MLNYRSLLKTELLKLDGANNGFCKAVMNGLTDDEIRTMYEYIQMSKEEGSTVTYSDMCGMHVLMKMKHNDLGRNGPK